MGRVSFQSSAPSDALLLQRTLEHWILSASHSYETRKEREKTRERSLRSATGNVARVTTFRNHRILVGLSFNKSHHF
jgi:hypothetical protein